MFTQTHSIFDHLTSHFSSTWPVRKPGQRLHLTEKHVLKTARQRKRPDKLLSGLAIWDKIVYMFTA